MEFEDIGRVWREEGTGAIRRTRVEDLSTVLERAKRVGAARRRRFARLAWVAAVPMVLVSGYMAWRAPNWLATSGAVVMVAFAVLVTVRYRAIGRRVSHVALPVRLALQAELTHLDALERLQRDASWIRALYWLGFGTYAVGLVAGITGDSRARFVPLGLFLSVFLIVEGLIRFGRRKGPRATRTLKEDMTSWLDSLDELNSREGGHPPATDHI